MYVFMYVCHIKTISVCIKICVFSIGVSIGRCMCGHSDRRPCVGDHSLSLRGACTVLALGRCGRVQSTGYIHHQSVRLEY